jgi:hypothetical protein
MVKTPNAKQKAIALMQVVFMGRLVWEKLITHEVAVTVEQRRPVAEK